MIEIPKNPFAKTEEEQIDEAVEMVLKTLDNKEGGEAYLDWGLTGNTFKNCISKKVAYDVARRFIDASYFVYYRRMGKGSTKVAEGEPVAIYIYTTPRNHLGFVRMY